MRNSPPSRKPPPSDWAELVTTLAVVRPGVVIPDDAEIGEFAVIGEPPRGFQPGDLKTVIGSQARIRTHTVIYAGSVIGDRFQSGHGAVIRENCRIGNDVSVGTGAVLERDVVMHDHARVHSQAFIGETTVLEQGAWVGPHAVVTNVLHPLCPRAKECLKGAVIRKGAKIGANVTILPDIEIGENSLVGAGSVVVKDVPPNVVVAGSPARIVKEIDALTCPYHLIERPYS